MARLGTNLSYPTGDIVIIMDMSFNCHVKYYIDRYPYLRKLTPYINNCKLELTFRQL